MYNFIIIVTHIKALIRLGIIRENGYTYISYYFRIQNIHQIVKDDGSRKPLY